MATWVTEVIEFKYEERCDLIGHLEAAMAPEATKMDVSGNKNTENLSFKIEIVENYLDSFAPLLYFEELMHHYRLPRLQ